MSFFFWGDNIYVHTIMKKKKIQIKYIEHHIWSDCVKYQILFSSTGRIIFHDLLLRSTEKKTFHACLASVKNECYRLVLSKSLMMLSARTSCFDFSRLRSQFQFLLVRRQTADDQSDREASGIKDCRGKAQKYILSPSKQRSWWNTIQSHQIDKISCATSHSSSVAAPTRQSNTRTQTLLDSITTNMTKAGLLRHRNAHVNVHG